MYRTDTIEGEREVFGEVFSVFVQAIVIFPAACKSRPGLIWTERGRAIPTRGGSLLPDPAGMLASYVEGSPTPVVQHARGRNSHKPVSPTLNVKAFYRVNGARV